MNNCTLSTGKYALYIGVLLITLLFLEKSNAQHLYLSSEPLIKHTAVLSEKKLLNIDSFQVSEIINNRPRSLAQPISVNLSAGIPSALVTEVSITPIQKAWKIINTANNSSRLNISVEKHVLPALDLKARCFMLISKSGEFDQFSEIKILKSGIDGTYQVDHDFDGTSYITFGIAGKTELSRSIFFDGLDDYVAMESNLNLNPTGFTISAWINRSIDDSGLKSIVSKCSDNFTEGYDLRITEDHHIEMAWIANGLQFVSSKTTLPGNEWHHIAVIFDGTYIRLYFDGVNDITAQANPPEPTNFNFKMAAAGQEKIQQHFKGHLDEVRLWNIALSVDELRYIMNQEIENSDNFVSGKIISNRIGANTSKTIPWENLQAYYPLSVYNYLSTEDASGNGNDGRLENLNTVDLQSAPLPYISQRDGLWTTTKTWSNHAFQTPPNSISIVNNKTTIDWNIVKIQHDVKIPSDHDLNREIKLLGLAVDNKLTVDGDTNNHTGNGLTVSNYLKLDGIIDLEGESQLILGDHAVIDPASIGHLEIDQQGTADNYTYNYWCSPVGKTNASTNNNPFTVKEVMFDKELPVNFLASGFDGAAGSPVKIADYWIWKFANNKDYDYSAWQHIRRNGKIEAGEGFTMKGPGTGSFDQQQNYVFRGKPNNGSINLTLNADNDYLVGNPYPSAIDAHQFIVDNGLKNNINDLPLINGTLYFWEHWGGGSHSTADYRGGYATYNFSGGVGAPSLGTKDANFATGGIPMKVPNRYIPVGKGFFVVGKRSGNVEFNNAQRVYKKENEPEPEDLRPKIRLGFNSVNTIHRQLLLTIDENTSTGYDWGYDAELFHQQKDDMFWVINGENYNIQGSNSLDTVTRYPMGITVKSSGLNSIMIDALEQIPDGLDIFIHDIENDSYHDLSAADFQFYLPIGSYSERFELTFSAQPDESLSTDDKKLKSLELFYSGNSKKLVLVNPNAETIQSIDIYDMLGQKVLMISGILETEYSEYLIPILSSGQYILNLNIEGSTISKQIIINGV